MQPVNNLASVACFEETFRKLRKTCGDGEKLVSYTEIDSSSSISGVFNVTAAY